MKNKKFQILIIEDNPKDLPYVCGKDGQTVSDGDIYIRTNTQSRKANNYQLDKLFERKFNAYQIPKHKDLNLEQHLEQLQKLYSHLTYTTSSGGISDIIGKLGLAFSSTKTVHKKEIYPKEDYDDFILRMLNKKKKRIEEELDI